MKKAEGNWKTYRCKFLIQAKRLSGPLVFVDALGVEQRGKKGDYLVQSANGTRRIWPRRLFEEAHVLLEANAPRRVISLKKPAASCGKAKKRPASRPLIA